MQITARLLAERVRWLVTLRWIACACTAFVVWFSSSVLCVLPDPRVHYAVLAGVIVYNTAFRLCARGCARPSIRRADTNILLQMVLDLLALTLLLYFSGIAHNPFLYYFVFHMILASLLLTGWLPYVLAGLSACLVGAVLFAVSRGWLPCYVLRFPHLVHAHGATDPHLHDDIFLLGLVTAFSSTLFVTVYSVTSLRSFLERAQAEMRQKEKMLGIGQLVAGIAHQIASPLDGVQNCLRALGKGVAHDPVLIESVAMMTEALDRIEHTARRVQSFARPGGLDLRPTDVNEALRATMVLLGDGRAHGIEIEVDVRPVRLARGDRHCLQEVIFNLCTNAVAAMPNGGKLTLRTRTVEDHDFAGGVAIAVEVIDTGVGIAEADFERVFEPFYTTRAATGGTGLGLGLCRMLVSEMGGRIELSSRVGRGTTFRVCLAVAEQSG